MSNGIKRSIATRTILLAADRMAQICSTLITSALIARGIGVEAYGQWQLAASFLFVLITLANFANADVMVPLLVQHRASAAAYASAALMLRVISVSVCLVPGLLFALFWLDGLSAAFLLLLLPLLFREPLFVIYMWDVAKGDTRKYVLVSVMSLCVRIGATSLVYILDLPIFWYFLPIYAENILYGQGLWILARQNDIISLSKLPKGLLYRLGIDSLIIWLSGLSLIAAQRADRFFLGSTITSESFGHYSAAAQINDNWIYVGIILTSSLAPMLIYSVSEKQMFRNIVRIVLGVAALCLIGAIIISSIADLLIMSVFGGAFTESSFLLQRTVWAYALVPIEMAMSLPLLRLKLYSWLAVKNFFILVLVFGGMWFLSPLYGVLAPAIAFGLAYTFALIVTAIKLGLIARLDRE